MRNFLEENRVRTFGVWDETVSAWGREFWFPSLIRNDPGLPSLRREPGTARLDFSCSLVEISFLNTCGRERNWVARRTDGGWRRALRWRRVRTTCGPCPDQTGIQVQCRRR